MLRYILALIVFVCFASPAQAGGCHVQQQIAVQAFAVPVVPQLLVSSYASPAVQPFVQRQVVRQQIIRQRVQVQRIVVPQRQVIRQRLIVR